MLTIRKCVRDLSGNYKRPAMIALCLLIFLVANAQQKDSLINIAHSRSLYSAILEEKRVLYVHTPSRMKPGERFPVIYLLDGEAFTEMAGGQVLYLSESYKITPSMIIVGIENTDRMRDLTPEHYNPGAGGKEDTSANAPGKTTGGGENFLRFIKEELMPFIELNYPVAPYRILAGHSLGGLIALYCLSSHPDYFNAYIAISPSLQWGNSVTLRQLPGALTQKTLSGKRLFFSDANEGDLFHSLQLRLDSLLAQKQAPGFIYRYIHYPLESHTSEPVKAFYDGLRLVYPEWHLTYNSSFRQKVTSDIITGHYKRLSEEYGYTAIPLQEEIVQVSRFLRNDPKRIGDAIDLLQTYIPYYPGALNMQELLGDIFVKAGDREKAFKVYEQVLAKDPKNEKLLQKMNELK